MAGGHPPPSPDPARTSSSPFVPFASGGAEGTPLDRLRRATADASPCPAVSGIPPAFLGLLLALAVAVPTVLATLPHAGQAPSDGGAAPSVRGDAPPDAGSPPARGGDPAEPVAPPPQDRSAGPGAAVRSADQRPVSAAAGRRGLRRELARPQRRLRERPWPGSRGCGPLPGLSRARAPLPSAASLRSATSDRARPPGLRIPPARRPRAARARALRGRRHPARPGFRR